LCEVSPHKLIAVFRQQIASSAAIEIIHSTCLRKKPHQSLPTAVLPQLGRWMKIYSAITKTQDQFSERCLEALAKQVRNTVLQIGVCSMTHSKYVSKM